MNKEPVLFLILLLANILPVITVSFFPTLDGAAHLYNSNLINSLIFDSSEMVQHYFSFNPELVPNWVGHLILSFFNLFLPAFLAEKILLLFYLIGLPLVFRSLIKIIQPNNLFLSYFIFPLSYSFVFFLGFYNFLIGLFFLFLSIKYVLNLKDEPLGWRNVFFLLLLTGLTFFSHLFIFGILLILIFLHLVFSFLQPAILKEVDWKIHCRFYLRKAMLYLIATLPAMILFAVYFVKRPPLEGANYLSKFELLNWITNMRPIVALDFSKEEIFSIPLYYTLLSLVIISFYHFFNAYFEPTTNSKKVKISLMQFFWGVGSLIILFLYFLLPDSNNSAGYVSVRIGLLFFLFLVLWLSTLDFSQWLKNLVILVVIVCNIGFLFYYSQVGRDLNKIAMECYRMSEKMEPYSVVLPINYSENWLLNHFSNYLGVDKPMVILENYESGTGYFPLVWNYDSMPNTKLDVQHEDENICSNWVRNKQNKVQFIDYLFILGESNSNNHICNEQINRAISNNYHLEYRSLNCRLYKRKNDSNTF